MRFSVVVSVFVFVLFLFPLHSAFALGISPAAVEVGSLLPNTVTTYSVELSRANPGVEQIGIIDIRGDDPYTIIAPESIAMPVGQDLIPVEFQIDTTGLVTGTYSAKLDVAGQLVEEQTGTNNVSGVQTVISFSVTNDEVDTESISGFSLQQNQEYELFTQFTHNNQGNIDTNISRIEIRGLHIESEEYYSETIEENYTVVPAYNSEDFRVTLNNFEEIGLYEFTLLWYNKNNQLISSHGPERFYVDGVAPVEEDSPMKPVAIIIALIAGIVVAVGAGIILHRVTKIKKQI